ncbi:N-acetyltransferase [Peribacillus cavernae]|uniref:N-acetyltransferase n=1 Tax=Peribacillus cavernae TaxID=1674310 RepID=A0A3S0VWU5_9BACI|nr:N-acetyltransferase [Peribacillus cavernae]MDQ0219275.1 putative N-acetyltransferase YhbS [Peribacillus cavernae]RUQ27835.1 N-acetyltransferase [Peribacillus cavernae]
MTIRIEKSKDFDATENIIKEAFTGLPFSDQKEHELVKRLRESPEFIPSLSLVYEVDEKIVGHILLTKLKINDDKQSFEALALAPVSVKPSYQRKGIGKEMIHKSLEMARESGFKAVVVMGHEHYYPKFGFEPASKWNIKAPFEVPDETFMVKELQMGSLKGIQGVVEYSPAFGLQ